jgi:hypothetical protein
MTDSTTDRVAWVIHYGIPGKAAQFARSHDEKGSLDLAADLATELSANEHRAALKILIEQKMRELITVDLLLDEQCRGSYTTVDKMAVLLFDEIISQDGHELGQEFEALTRLLADEIEVYSRLPMANLAGAADPGTEGTTA